MSYESLERFKLERLINELKSKRGRGTELISLYIPAGRPIGDVTNVLRQEYSTATNIKDRTTRHHVLEALTSVMQRLKLFKQTPPNGLVIFCGYVAGKAPGDEKLEVHVLEPPRKLNTYLYRCDSRFHTEILEDMIAVKESYGLIAMDRGEAAIAVLRGKSVEIVDRVTSGVPGKHKAGGQSARRFARIIEQMAHEYYKRVGEHANKIFLSLNDLSGIIIGGPGPTKEEFAKGDYLHYELKKKVLAVLDIGYSGEEGIYELLRASSGILKDVEYFKEKKVVQEFFKHVVNDTGLATYGEREVREALEMGAVSKLLLSAKVEGYRVEARCSACSFTFSKTVKDPEGLKCPRCGGGVVILSKKPLIEDLAELAEKTGAEVRIISSETEEGEALRKSFGGIAAILRFKIETR